MLSKKCQKKIALSTTQIIQKGHSFHSESRNYRNNLKQNNKAFKSSKVINGVNIQSKRKLSGFDINIRDKYYKYPFNKFQPAGGMRNSISFGSNNTNMASPGIKGKDSISKVDNSSKKTINLPNNDDKNALL